MTRPSAAEQVQPDDAPQAARHRSRVLCVVPSLSGIAGEHPNGQATAARGLLGFLVSRGHEVELLNTSSALYPPMPMHRKIWAAMQRTWGAHRVLRGGDVSAAVLFTGSGLSLLERVAICALCRRAGVRHVLFFRNSDVLEQIARNGASRLVLKYLLRVPRLIAVQGERWVAPIGDLGVARSRTVVVPNWLPPEVPAESSPKSVAEGEVVHFVFVGRLVPNKGVDTLLDASLNELAGLPHRVTVVGGGPLERHLRERLASVSGAVIDVKGACERADVYEALRRAHVFVLPTFHNEGFPNALLEAMALGLPAISTNVGSITDSLCDGVNGFVVQPRDPVGLAAAMAEYIRSPSLVTTHSARALDTVETRHRQDATLSHLWDALMASGARS